MPNGSLPHHRLDELDRSSWGGNRVKGKDWFTAGLVGCLMLSALIGAFAYQASDSKDSLRHRVSAFAARYHR